MLPRLNEMNHPHWIRLMTWRVLATNGHGPPCHSLESESTGTGTNPRDRSVTRHLATNLPIRVLLGETCQLEQKALCQN